MISHFSSFHLFFSLSHPRCQEAFIRLSCHHTNSIALRSLHHCLCPLHSWSLWGKVLSCLVQHFSEQNFVVSRPPRNNNKKECPYFPPDLCLILCTGGIPLPREFNIHVFKNQPLLSSLPCVLLTSFLCTGYRITYFLRGWSTTLLFQFFTNK